MKSRISPGVIFGTRFFVCLLLFSTLFWAFSVHEHLGPVQGIIATLSAEAERWTGGQAFAQGDDIIIKNLIMTINHECTGVFVCILFASFVLAYPASWRARAVGLAIGVPLFFVVNVIRLATLARVVEVYPGAFFYMHEYVWQGILTVFVLLGAIAWAEKFG
jgi:exosortase/archaeosortase family protein